MPVINSDIFKKKHGLPVDKPLSLKKIASLSGMPVAALMEVYDRGMGAYKTNPSSVRPQVKSAQQWAMARVYSFVMRRATTFGGADSYIAKKYKISPTI
jgi:hypothetical protein